MRVLVMCVIALLLSTAVSAEKAYLIIDAFKFPENQRQPTWIAVLQRNGVGELIHLPTGKTIVEIKPGKYIMHHIDFRKSVMGSMSMMFFDESDHENYIEVPPDTVVFVGAIVIKRSRARVQRIDEMLQWACAINPELISSAPIRLPGTDGTFKLLKVNCRSESIDRQARPST